MDRMPQIRFHGEHLVMIPGPEVVLRLPVDGQVLAQLPWAKDNRRWLITTLDLYHRPLWHENRWHLPRNCLTRAITAAVDRYGYVAVVRDMATLSRCDRRCQEATGGECSCSCMGAHHGENSPHWYERHGDAVVSDRGEFTRSAIMYGPCGADGDAQLYRGELAGRPYRTDRNSRRDWPSAATFMCACCATERAQVWDHCHTHGLVRAPLCSPCNTRHWHGWQAAHGRASRSRNVDESYYRWCGRHGVEGEQRPCSR
ncbi:endonuclease domain-containing protein [Nonomuraea sp. NPDC049646]|uniref:endonuclease domain-containing protein n=1 Tax=unclassified Nonomuraea TaxID=2593643 RepID=UPI0037BBB6D9